MMISQSPKKSVGQRIIVAVAVFLIFLSTATPMSDKYHSQIVLLMFGCVTVTYFVRKKVISNKVIPVSKNLLLIALAYLIFFALTIIWNRDTDISHYLGVWLTVISALMFVSMFDFSEYRHYFITFCQIVSIYSVLITIYLNINPSFAGTFSAITIDDLSWQSIGVFYNVWGWSPWSTVIRNSAFFREPGVWGGVASIAAIMLIQEMSGKEWKRKDYIKLGILFVGALTSLSTSAFIAIALNICLFVYDNGKITKGKLLMLMGGLTAFFAVIFQNYDRLFSKLIEGSSTYMSLQQRTEGQLAGLNSWLNNPFLGSGFTYYVDNIVGTSANSFVDILGKYGIIVFAIAIAGLLASLLRMFRKKMSVLIVMASLIVILSTQNLIFYPPLLILVFYGYKSGQTQDATRINEGQSNITETHVLGSVGKLEVLQ